MNIDDWKWDIISYNISIEDVRKYPNMPWNLNALSQKSDLTVNDIDNLVLPNAVGKWNWGHISWSINSDEVMNNLNKPWNIHYLSKNPTLKDISILDRIPKPSINDPRIFLIKGNNINNTYREYSINDVRQNIHCPFKMYIMTKSIHINDIVSNPDIPWDIHSLTFNPTLTVEFIKNNPNYIWNWIEISSNISMEEVRNNITMPWKKIGLSHNKYLTMNDIITINNINF